MLARVRRVGMSGRTSTASSASSYLVPRDKTRESTKVPLLGPDFIGIGAARCGTSWIYEVLGRHPAIWLPPIKELHYFDDPARKRYYRFLRMRLVSGFWIKRPLSRWDWRYFVGRPSDEWYCQLFEPGRRRGLLTGEITPGYSILNAQTFARVKALNPDVKLLFMMRDPIMRCWSAVIKRRQMEGLREMPTAEDAIRMARYRGVWARSLYTDCIEKIERLFSPAQIFYGFFEELSATPDLFVRRLLSFLQVESPDFGPTLPAPLNAAAAGTRPPELFERTLAAALLPSVQKLCDRFDGPPHDWQARYRALLDG
jgi:hypothetical protein